MGASVTKIVSAHKNKTDKSKTSCFTFGGTSRTKSFGEELMFPNQYDSQKKIYVLCVK